MNFYPEMETTDAEQMKQELQKAGIGHICGSVLKKEFRMAGFPSIRTLNREALALKNILGDFYTPGFHIHPGFVRESCEEIGVMQARGLRLMGELVPYMHGWGNFPAKNWMEIMNAAKGCGMVCSYHTPFGFDMEEMLRTHREIPFVAAHPGDRDRVAEHIAAMKKHDNLYLDLSGTGLFRLGLVRHLVNEVGEERILFGSDYPICNPHMYVQAVLSEQIPDRAKARILHENARRLLGIAP